jgi:DNA-binding response OmpR family regulator
VGKIRVLIVDSDPDASEDLAQLLKEKADYDVQTVHGTFETGLTAQKFTPHAILINLLSEGISAMDICKTIRMDEELQTMKVIALANRLSESESTALLQKGFDGFVTDPADIDEIIRTIEETTAIIY